MSRHARIVGSHELFAELDEFEINLFYRRQISLHDLDIEFAVVAKPLQHVETDPVSVEASWMMATVPLGCGIAIDAGTDGCRFLEPNAVGSVREELRRAA